MSKSLRIPQYIKNKDGFKVPVFVKLNDIAMRYDKIRDEYYRDGGNWSVDYVIKSHKIYSIFKYDDYLNNKELIKITKKEWSKDNGQYTPKDSEIKINLFYDNKKVCKCCGQLIKN